MNHLVIKTLLIFLLIFDISFKFLPFISTGKIVFLIMAVWYFFEVKKVSKFSIYSWGIISLYCFIVFYNILLYVTNGFLDNTALLRIIYFVLYSLVLSTIFSNFFNSKKEFMLTFTLATFIQSLFVIVSWLSPEYRLFVDSILVQTGNLSLLNDSRPPGFMNSAGAKASVLLALGGSFSLYLFLNEKKSNNFVFILMYFILAIATFIVGRTGLVVLLVLSVLLLIINAKHYLAFIKKIGITAIVFSSVVLIANQIVDENFQQNIDEKKRWVTEEFSSGLSNSPTVTVLSNMTIKPLGIDTLVGTSLIRLPEGQHDSGYIQTYHSMGLIFAFLFYFTVFSHLIMSSSSKENYNFIKKNFMFIFALVAALFIVEIKEPFLLSYMYLFVLFTILKIKEEKDRVNCIEE